MKGIALAVSLVCWQADAAGLETARWQAEIDAAAARGGGRVVVPSGVHPVGQLDLRSNVELHLEEGSVLQGAVGLEHYRVVRLPYSEGTWSAIVMGLNVTNVAVTGRGVIHGQGDRWPQPENYGGLQEGRRARGLFFANSKDIRLEGFTLRDSACWGIVLKCCDGMRARNVTIDSHANANNDGFDVEAKNVIIENCDVDSGDDAFCIKSNNPDFSVENVLVRDCVARSHCNALKLGTASHGVMRNIRFERCTVAAPRRDFTDGRRSSPKFGKGWFYRAPGPSAPKGYPDYPNGVCGCAMAVEDVDGGRVVDVSFEDISFSGCIVPIFVRGGLRTGRATGAPANTLCDFDRVSFRNVRGTAEGVLPSTVSGVDACRPRNVSFEDVAIVCRGEGRSDRPFDEIGPEFADAYPEASMFKDLRLPAFGLYADRADGVTLRNVRFELAKGESDRREPVAFAKTAAAVAGTGRPVPKNVPELMLCENGSRVTGIRDWEDVRRPELLNVFSREVYGVRPVERPPKLTFEVVREDPEALGGTAVLKVVRIVYGGPYGARDFRAIAFFPKTGRPAPTFVYIALSGDGLNTHRMDGERQEWPKFTEERWPVQKILARGYATVAFRVTDLAPDDDCGFGIGAWRCFETRESRREDSWGALSVWAWGASRVADWLETEPLADSARLATVGLSRCGKTSILACATDTRFAMCCTSGAGCCGDKLNHVELAPVQDEHIAQILRFRHWFSRRFDKYAGRDLDLPFDQHELLALIAPRLLCVAAASEDDGAGPYGQFLSASFASPAWELYGKRGLVAAEFPGPGQALQDGSVSFHLRKGDHDLTAFDWNLFMDFADRNGWTKPKDRE